MPSAYRPYRGSTAARVLAFFQQNPGEELTRRDVAVKFGLDLTSVPTALASAVEAGLLVWRREAGGLGVYCAPPPAGKQEVTHG